MAKVSDAYLGLLAWKSTPDVLGNLDLWTQPSDRQKYLDD